LYPYRPPACRRQLAGSSSGSNNYDAFGGGGGGGGGDGGCGGCGGISGSVDSGSGDVDENFDTDILINHNDHEDHLLYALDFILLCSF
jgi:hypothetical protein